MIVERLLKEYHSLADSEAIELREVKLDLDRALGEVVLTDEERYALHYLYLIEPLPPRRTPGAGRPAGGTTQKNIALEAGMSQATMYRRVQSAIQKLSLCLGEGYSD